MIKVYVNDSLDMPIGKICAQVSHGLMGLVLDRFTMNNGNLCLVDKKSIDWFTKNYLNQFKFELIFSDFSNQSVVDKIKSIGSSSTIIDQGRTCFNGVPTLTVIANTDEKLIDYKREIQKIETENTDNESRQILLLDRSIDLESNKIVVIKEAALASLHNLLVRLESSPDNESMYFDLSKDDALKNWLLGSFAKITLSVKGETKLANSVEKVDQAGICFHSRRIGDISAITAFGPCKKIDSLPLTKRMQLL